MSPIHLRWIAPASRRRLAFVVAAVVLVLHWAAPHFQVFGVVPSTHGLVYASIELGPYRGTLPRLSARAHSLEAGIPKPDRAVSPPAEKSKAFHADVLVLEFGQEAVATYVPCPLVLLDTSCASFEARAPPQRQA